MYIVKYCGGEYEDYYIKDIFVTNDENIAIKYANKFNSIIEKWKKHYKQFEEERHGMTNWIKREFIEQHYYRWSLLRDITECYYEKIEVR